VDNYQKEEYRKVLDNDTTEVWAKYLEQWGNSSPRIGLKVITKDRFVKIKQVDTTAFMDEIRGLKLDLNNAGLHLNSLNEELIKCKQTPKAQHEAIKFLYYIGFFLVGLLFGALITKLVK
jgi:hypothetical protein